MSKTIHVEVAYALPDKQTIIALDVEEGCDVRSAIDRSGILQLFPDIDLAVQQVGIFSKKCDLTHVLAEGDRVEIYRPLTIDPKEARRAKAKMRAKAGKSK